MSFAFRVDAAPEMGTGHLMRCLTLADSLRQVCEIKARFVYRHMPPYLVERIRNQGYETVGINMPLAEQSLLDELHHSRWLGVTQQQDAQDCLHALEDYQWDWLVVDHYALGQIWETKIRAVANRIMAIDDIADRVHDCDTLLDQNFYADMRERYVGKVPEQCRLLLGPSYALLREEFFQVRNRIAVRKGPVQQILVFLGGADSENYTRLVLDALTTLPCNKIKVDVVIGAQHPARGEIEQVCAQHGFLCHVQTNRMAELMANADMAIGAGGSATWERCITGLPSILLVIADNQAKAVADLAAAGIVLNAGNARTKRPQDLAIDIQTLLEDEELRSFLSTKSIALMTSSNGKTVAEILTESYA